MKLPLISFRPVAFIFTLALSVLSQAKDVPIALAQCPAPVQAVIQHYSQQGSLESVAVDKDRSKPVYEAKFSLTSGKRVEVHIAEDGKILKLEDKKSKSKK